MGIVLTLLLAVAFAFAPAAHSAIVTYDVMGHGSYTDPTTVLGPLPFSSLSVVNLDIVGADVSLVSASLASHGALSFGAAGFVERFDTFTVTGGTGMLSGNAILWTTPAPGEVLVEHSAQLFCSGVICAVAGLEQGLNPPGVGFPEGRYGQSPDLGRWILSADLTQILGSTRAVFTVGGLTPPPELGEPAEWLVFGDADLGFVPEPPASGLALLAFAALYHPRRWRRSSMR
jgi:hypothetical protein